MDGRRSTAAHLHCFKLLRALRSDRARCSARPEQQRITADPFTKQTLDISKQVNQPLGVVLKHLGEQLGLTIKWDKALPPSAEHKLITIEANKRRLDEILADLGSQSKLSISRVGTLITITASPRSAGCLNVEQAASLQTSSAGCQPALNAAQPACTPSS